jgi:hypothetical protein
LLSNEKLLNLFCLLETKVLGLWCLWRSFICVAIIDAAASRFGGF